MFLIPPRNFSSFARSVVLKPRSRSPRSTTSNFLRSMISSRKTGMMMMRKKKTIGKKRSDHDD
jgi:hypothetical protein